MVKRKSTLDMDFFSANNQVATIEEELKQTNQELEQANHRIQDLEQTLESLAGKDLSENARTQATLAIQQIVRDPAQARRWFDPTKLQSLATAIQKFGFRGSLWVRLLNGKHYLIAGERRLRSAELAGLTHVPVDIFEVDDETAQSLSAIENLQREDLNALEETDIVLSLLSQKLRIEEEDTIRLLYRMKNFKEARAKLADSTSSTCPEEYEVVEAFFVEIGRFTWETFIRNRLTLRNLPPDILEAIRTAQLEFTHAKQIAKVKDLDDRQSLLERALSEALSVEAIKQEVRALTQKPATVKDEVREILKIKSSHWDSLDARREKKVRQLLTELKQILSAR